MMEPPVESGKYTQDYYLEDCGGSEFFALYGARILKPVLAYALKRARVAPGMTALDVGCGRGELLHHLRERGALGVGCDFALPALRLAQETSKAPVLRCDAKKLPFADGTFDRIFFLGVIDHLHDWELEACFAEFRRLLKRGGEVLANTCTNTDYHKNLSYGLRCRLARTMKLGEPRPPRSSQDAQLHVNEHCQGDLERFFAKIGWRGEIELRPNDKYSVGELYGEERPADLPIKAAPPWKSAWHAAAFRGPWKRFLARELFCKVTPL